MSIADYVPNCPKPGDGESDPVGTDWIFGYGSLIWRPDFEYVERAPAQIHGYVRRFWQGSPDHRGTPDAPGRVVTLVPQDDGLCCGIAYRVAPEKLHEVVRLLDIRESGGYTRIETTVHIGRGIKSIVYVADPLNPHYLGPATTERMAGHIGTSRGPSGSNIAYLLELQKNLRRLGIQDQHVNDLAETARLQRQSD